jgi:NADH:ubiquinone oxidoreductase subunit 4 (subunit M)
MYANIIYICTQTLFIGEFMALYGVFEKLPLLEVLASSSVVLSSYLKNGFF